MTDEQKYSAVLRELGALLADKNATISSQRWQIDQLKKELAAAEKERDEHLQHIYKLNDELVAALTEMKQLKGGAA